MHREGDEIHVTTEEASGGVTGHGVRYVLGFSLAITIIGLGALLWLG